MRTRLIIALGILAAVVNSANAMTTASYAAACNDSLWYVDQLFGIQARLAYAVANQPLGTEQSRRDLLNASQVQVNALRHQMANLTIGLAGGLTAPRANVERVVAQLDAMLDSRARVMSAPLARDGDAQFGVDWKRALDDSIVPALNAYRSFLRDTYLANARAEPGLSAVPGGAACYAEKVSATSGMQLNLDSLYDEAVQRRMQLVEQIRTAGSQLLGSDVSATDVMRRLRTDPRYVVNDPDSVVTLYSASLARARTALPLAFAKLPDAPLIVRAISKTQAPTAAPAQYESAAPGSNAPSVFLVNAYQPGGIARMNITMGALHEAYPGHHFQSVYASMNPSASSARGYGNIAYLEGWGIYAERLGGEMGLLEAPIDRLGCLVHLYDVFMALQIDIGMHARGWTRAQAIDTMLVVAARPVAQAESYADRHAATPSQLASYGIGFLAIVQARESAERALGSRFDVRAFHDVVLRDGVIALPDMRAHVDAWVQSLH